MSKTQTYSYNLLKSKEIMAILDGDTEYGNIEINDGKDIRIAMPYLSGPDICNISTLFGMHVSYNWGGVNLSRWNYLENLFIYCMENDKTSDLLAYLFSKEQFSKMLSGYSVNIIEDSYKHVTQTVIKQINGLLYFGGNELVIIDKKFVVREIGRKVEIEVPKINSIDREYIKDISTRAMNDIENENYDSAVTKSRTLLEETFCYVIERKNEIPSNAGDIGALYKQVKGLYNMHGDKDLDKRINTLLSGLEKIISSISEMRNKDSDAHGVGAKRIRIDEHHARLIVNSSMTMADFILAVENKNY
ncbi:MAG: abortive infection family protein [Gudongella sp.]|nr:abortive infection family protein [Gudongella sp.]